MGLLATVTALAAILLVGTACKSTKSTGPEAVGTEVQLTGLRQVVLTQVADPGRSSAILGLVDRAERELGAINETFMSGNEEFAEMSADHSVSAGELQAFYNNWEGQVSAKRLRMIDTILAMKPYATAEEWPAISHAFVDSVLQQSDRYQKIRMTHS